MDTSELLQRVRRVEIKTRALTRGALAGQYHSAFKGRGMSFSEVREYHIGDDVRDIDWNVTARTGKPHVKQYEEERELTVMLLVDVSGSLDFGTRGSTLRELLTEVAATLAMSAMMNGDKVGAIFFGDKIEKYIPPASSRSHILYLIRELLTMPSSGRHTDLSQALEYVVRVQKRRAVVFLLSDFLVEQDYRRPLSIAARRHDVVALRLVDTRLTAMPNIGFIKLYDAETGHEQYVDTTAGAVRKSQEQWWKRHSETFRDTLSHCGIDFTDIYTGRDYLPALMALMKKR